MRPVKNSSGFFEALQASLNWGVQVVLARFTLEMAVLREGP